MDSGDGYPTLWMYLMPLNRVLKMVKMINLLLCILYHNKKKERKRKRTTYQSMKWEGTLIPLGFLASLVQWAELSK